MIELKPYNSLFLVLTVTFLLSCKTSGKKEFKPEPCNEVSLSRFGILTYGFKYSEIDTVKIKVFKKGSDFKTLDSSFSLYNNDHLIDETRQLRDIDLPDFITSNYDFSLTLADTLEYKISDMVVGLEDVEKGYECSLSFYKLNGVPDSSGSNITIHKNEIKE